MSTKQDHKRWRKQFNEDCLKRDNNKCRFCNDTDDLDVHHIIDRHEMPNGGYVMSNGVTVCNVHHNLCEDWHRGGGGIVAFSPIEVFKAIGSSYEQALEDSKNLK